jgi:hypothetical protein
MTRTGASGPPSCPCFSSLRDLRGDLFKLRQADKQEGLLTALLGALGVLAVSVLPIEMNALA